jgi:hypothetical protein
MWTFYVDGKDACITARVISGICCDLSRFVCDLLPFGLLDCAAGPVTSGKSWRE